MQHPDLVRSRKQRCNRCVLAGTVMMALALVVSFEDLAPMLTTTAAAFVGFVLLMYGVHVGWLVFYEKESDGPPC